MHLVTAETLSVHNYSRSFLEHMSQKLATEVVDHVKIARCIRGLQLVIDLAESCLFPRLQGPFFLVWGGGPGGGCQANAIRLAAMRHGNT